MKLYVIWSVVYILLQLPFGFLNNIKIVDLIITIVFKATYYHLWYLVALIYAILMFGLLVWHRIKSVKVMWIVCLLLWLLGCLHYPYYWLEFYQKIGIAGLIDRYEGLFNALFIAGPLLIAGYIAKQKNGTGQSSYWIKGTIISFVVWMIEITILFFKAPGVSYLNYSLITPLFSYYTIGFLSSLHIKLKHPQFSNALRDSSLFIYCVHPLFIYLYTKLIGGNGIKRWLWVLFASIISSAIFCFVKKVIKDQHSGDMSREI